MAKFDPKANELHTIFLMNKGLNPALQNAGFKDKNTLQSFTTVQKYTEFLLKKECDLLVSPEVPPSTYPTVTHRPWVPTAQRVNMAQTVDCDDQGTEGDQDGWEDEEVDDETSWDDYEDGRVCGVRGSSRQDRNRPDKRVNFRGKAGGPPPTRPAPVLISVPAPGGGQGVPRPLFEFKLALTFPTPETVWPTGFTFTPSMVVDTGVRMSYVDRVMRTVGVLDPVMSLSRVHHVLMRLREPTVDPNWKWCIIHGSPAHTTLDCPCVAAICPKIKGAGRP
jgi:hypothetical protein